MLFAIQLLFTMMATSVFAQVKNGNVVIKEERNLKGFHTVNVSGLAKVYLTQATNEGARIEVSGMPVDDLVIAVQDSILRVETRGTHNGEIVKVFVNYRSLKSIHVGDAAELHSVNTVVADNLSIAVQDAGDADLAVNVTNLEVALKESRNLKVTGKAKHQVVHSVGEQGHLDDSGLIK